MATYITSDLHFGHNNIMKFNPATRPFKDADHMNSEMIRMWNERVQHDDLVYILGDFAFCNANKATEIAGSLMGRKILIEGNHDNKLVQHADFRAQFEEIHKYHEITFDGTRVVMFHYPIAEFNQMHRGAVHFHGHLHGAPSGMEQYRVLDAGMDATGEIVSSMEQMVARALKGELKKHGYVESVIDSKGHHVKL